MSIDISTVYQERLKMLKLQKREAICNRNWKKAAEFDAEKAKIEQELQKIEQYKKK